MKDVTRCVSTGFWKDDKVLNTFSPEDKYFMLYLLTNPHTTQLGIYHLPIKIAAVELGYSVDTIHSLLERFEKKYNIIRYNKETGEVAIKNFLRYSIIKGGKPVMDCLIKDCKTIKDTTLISYVLKYLDTLDNKYLNNTVLEFINRYIKNNNNNDNERYVDDSYHDSYHDSLESEEISNIKPVRHRYGTYKNVLLSDEQMEKLKKEFPDDWEEWIEKVSEYCKSKGKTYSDYLATIRSWKRKEKKKQGGGWDSVKV